MLHKYLSMIALAGALSSTATFGQAPPAAQAARPGPRPIPRALFISDMDTEFRKKDADKNGVLTRIEIEQFLKLQAVANAQERNQGLFVRLDADRNGQVSPAEFARLVQPPPASNAQPELSRLDGNRDGQVSLIEHRTATLANFDRLDTDKDGVVSAAEMKAGGIGR